MLLNPSFVDKFNSENNNCQYLVDITVGDRTLAVVEDRARYALSTAQVYFELYEMEYTFELCSDYGFYQEHNVPDEKDYELLLDHIKHRFFGVGYPNPGVKCYIKPVGKRVTSRLP